MEDPMLFALLLNNTLSPVVLDGGLATELERKGCDISGPLWSAKILMDQPQLIEQTHLDYFNAGARVAITASYQASVPGLMQHLPSMTEKEAIQLIHKSVQLAKKARETARNTSKSQHFGADMYIAGSVGPYGAYLADGSEYRGDYDLLEQDMKNFHRPRMNALAEAGVDVLAFETIPSYHETVALLHLLEEQSRMSAWFSFTVKDASHISDGTSLEKVVKLLENSHRVLAMGVNCVSAEMAEGALMTLSTLTAKPLVVYPNSGEDYDATTKSWSGELDHNTSLEEKVKKWQRLGARMIGGCCRTTPETIKTIRRALHGS